VREYSSVLLESGNAARPMLVEFGAAYHYTTASARRSFASVDDLSPASRWSRASQHHLRLHDEMHETYTHYSLLAIGYSQPVRRILTRSLLVCVVTMTLVTPNLSWKKTRSIFTCDGRCAKCVDLSYRKDVRPCVRVSFSPCCCIKTVQAKITNSSLCATTKTRYFCDI